MKARFLALAALVLGLASCQTEPEGLNVNVGGEVDTFVTVTIPETETRYGIESNSALSVFDNGVLGTEDDNVTMRYILDIYYGEHRAERKVAYQDAKTIVTFPVRLVAGRDYNFVVWADVVKKNDQGEWADLHYNTTDLTNVTLYNTWVAMDESRDAFTGYYNTVEEGTKYTGNLPINITLTRPFAKLRVITTDVADLDKLGLKAKRAKVVYTTPYRSAFNAATGTAYAANESDKKTHDTFEIASYADSNNGKQVLFTDYFFATDEVVKFDLAVYDEAGNVFGSEDFLSFNTDIPVKRNYLTTIQGNILTENGNVTVNVEEAFENGSTWNPNEDEYDYATISGADDFYNALNTAGEFIVISDLEIDAPAITRATRNATEGKVTTINLNGKTITVTNKTGEPFATVAAGNTLFLEGGNIVLTEDSDASFIENNGNVVLTSGEINNNSTAAPVVEGTIIVDEGTVNDNEAETVESENWLADVLANGGTYVFTEDMKAGQIKVTATAPVVLDGNGYTFTYTGSARAIEIPMEATGANVTIKNLNIVLNASYCERGINFNVTDGTLTIDNVKVSETGTAATYAINLPGYSDNATVVINNSYLRGNIALNVWGKDMKITATDTEFVSYDNVEAENYAAISLNNDGATNIADGTVVTIEGGKIIALDENGEKSDAISNLTNTGTVAVSGSTEVIGILSDPVAIVTYAGYDQFYSCTTLQQAINQAAKNSNATVKLIKDITLDETVVVAENQTIALDLNGKTITGPSAARDAEGNRIHVIINNGTLTVKNGTIKSTADNGGSAVMNNGTIVIEDVTLNGAPIVEGGWPSYAVNNYGNLTVNGATINTYHGAIATGGDGVAVINDATVDVGQNTQTKQTSWALYVFENGQLTVNNGTFKNTKDEQNKVYGGGYICATSTKETVINGGTFDKTEGDNNGKGIYYNCTNLIIKGGTFDTDPTTHCAEGYAAVQNVNGTWSVIPTVLKDGAVLDLGGAEYNGTITVEGNVTIKGNTKIKTLKSSTGCTITIEDGKTLALNNFSFGAKDNANAEYEIKGGTVTANYGFFQHGTYVLRSNFETGYMYYSFGSDITVYGTFHSQGKGDGLDYVRGKLTIANGGKSIHDKSLWVGQPASWGAMEASLIIEEGGYVQANSLSVYEGSSVIYSNDADLKYNSVTGTEYITKK